FDFHSLEGDPYWDESAYYRFTLEEIEEELESAAETLEELCFDVVDRVVVSDELMTKLAIPAEFRDYIAQSWKNQDRNLYGRMDFCYDGKGPPKLYEYNADTPTSLYETSIFQWVGLEQAMERALIPQGSDQFHSVHAKLVAAFGKFGIDARLVFACARDSLEDSGTIDYLADCAQQAGLETGRLFMDEIGIDPEGRFTDLDDMLIPWLFKLYPWEWLVREEVARNIPGSGTRFIEPAREAGPSTKGFLPLLWQKNRNPPNLLPAYFEGDAEARSLGDSFVKKPLYSREGWNVEVTVKGVTHAAKDGQYGAEGHILQAYHPLPDY